MIIDMMIVKLAYGIGRSARFIWDHRLGFIFGALVFCAYTATTSLPLYLVLPAWLILAAVVAYDLRFERRLIGRLASGWTGATTGRHLTRAALESGVALSVERVSKTLPGELVDVRLGPGQAITALESQQTRDKIANGLDVVDVRVIRGETKARARVSIIRRDTLAAMGGVPWPLMNAESVDVDDGILFGRNEYGLDVKVRLLSRNLLLGGAPDAGKSAALRLLIAACALAPNYRLWLLDAKTGGAEFVHWAPVAHRLVRGRDVVAAANVLAELEQSVTEREQAIVAAGEVFVLPNMVRDVLFIDELPQFLVSGEDDSKDEAAAVKFIRHIIWKLISTGRWAGMPTVLSAQKPTADIVPSQSRDLIDHRFGLHCNTRQMSDAIFGDGNAGEVAINATEIPSGQPGVGYYLGDHGVQKIRTFHMDHRQAGEIASRLAARRIDAELEAMA